MRSRRRRVLAAFVLGTLCLAPMTAGAQDSDGDGLLDTVETNTGIFVDAMNTGSDPLVFDSDGDNWDDGTEVTFGTDPTDPASTIDANSGKLRDPDGGASDRFGTSVALSSTGDTAIVGASFDDTAGGNDSGSASVFVRDGGGTWILQEKILAPDGSGDDRFGSSVALSSTGDTAIVGAPLDVTVGGIYAGSASVFTRDGAGIWTFEKQLLAPDGAANDFFGHSVALSSTGDTAIVGAYGDNNVGGTDAGSASVFTRDGAGTWTFQEQLLAPDGAPNDSFGISVALSSTGDTSIVGAYLDDFPFSWANAGSASVFTRNGAGSWTFQQQIFASPIGADDRFGNSVALSSTGDTAIVGASADNTAQGTDAGSASVFTRDGAGIWTFRQQILAPGGAANDNFGSSVAISSMGDTAIVGAPLDGTVVGTYAGSASVFTRDGAGTWTFQEQFLAPDGAAGDRFGTAVSLSSTGGSAIVGAFRDDIAGGSNQGSAYVLDFLDTDGDGVPNLSDSDDDGDGLLDIYETNTGTFVSNTNTGTDPLVFDSDGDNWDDGSEVTFGTYPTDPASTIDANSGKLLSPDRATDDYFGISVALSSTGETAIVGAYLDDTAGGTDAGSASVFIRDGVGTWTLQQKLQAPDGDAADRFGTSVAISSTGDTAIVGAWQDDTAGGVDAGSASVFTRDGVGNWALQQQLLAPDSTPGDEFGFSVALSSTGDTAIVGVISDDTAGGFGAGSASVFTRDGSGVWSFQQQLLAPDGEELDQFGSSVALSSAGDTAVVGSSLDSTVGGFGAGSVSVFIRDGAGAWTFQHQLLAPDGEELDQFGSAVALSSTGDTAIVGAPEDSTATAFGAGSASVFTRDGAGTWTFQQQLLAPDGSAGDWFGVSVALLSTGDTAIVGVFGDDTAGGTDAGSASVFTRNGAGLWTFQEQLVTPDGAAGDEFGFSVALSSTGGTAIVGAQRDSSPGAYAAGSAYVFDSPDTDGDGVPNRADLDDDNDGVPDTSDAFPLDPTESLDTDGDGAGNNADTDDDGDGVPDSSDAFPLDDTESVDTDGDGTGNNADTDDDDDGVPDTSDAFPLDAAESVDTDDDGTGDNADTDDDGDGLLDTVETNTGVFVDATNTGTDPLVFDSDGDNWDDGTEFSIGTDPTDPGSTLDPNSGKLLAPDGAANDFFGGSVAISSTGDTAIVGAILDDTTGGIDAGSASVFTRDGAGTWTLQEKLLAPDGSPGDVFGYSVALSSTGDTAAVAAVADDTAGGFDAGSVSVFTRDGAGTWTFQQQLLAPGGATGDNFGSSVALSSTGDTAIVGTWKDDVGIRTDAGSASLFTRDGAGTWTFRDQILSPSYAAGDEFGTSVALSPSGYIAIVGAPGDETGAGFGAGSASVFNSFGGSNWSFRQQLVAPDGAAGDAFGISVALSSSGETAVVGAYLDDTVGGSNTGSVNVFRSFDGLTWTFQQQLLAPDGAAGDWFGTGVSVVPTGNIVIVGAYFDDTSEGSHAGSASAFSRDVFGTWTFQEQFMAPDGAAGDRFGYSVALSSTGGTAIVGAYLSDTLGGSAAGSAYLFESPDTDGDGVLNISDNDDDGDGLLDTVETNTGVFVDATSTGTDPLIFDSDGDNWDDGTEVAFGTDPTDPGSTLDPNSGKLLDPNGETSDFFGTSVAVSSDGNTAIVGSLNDSTTGGSDAGSASVFTRDGAGTWILQEKLLVPDGAPNDRFGTSVALSSTGDIAIVGAELDDTVGGSQSGSASVFTRDGSGTWTFQQQLLAPDGATNDFFGGSVAISSAGDIAIVGAEFDNNPAGGSGSASVFTRDGAGIWTFQEQLLDPDSALGDYFGISVALSSAGDTAIVGAYYDDSTTGSASVFTRDGAGTWTFQQKLFAPDGATNDLFGISVALSSTGDTAIVGANYDDTVGGTNAGSASVFTRDGAGAWTFEQQLLAPDGATHDLFGISVALSSTGDTAIVGAHDDDTTGGSDAGSASVFIRDGAGTWTWQEMLQAPDGATNDGFGTSVALSSTADTAIVGAQTDSTAGGVAAGSAYVFNSPDADGDGVPNRADLDDDDDGVPDTSDAFPLDAAESVDTDGDGTGNNADLDDDDDGVPDTFDAFPLDVTESVDTDGDGTGNNADLDDDDDGVPDTSDAFPLDAAESVDTDGDGTGNNADTDDDGDGLLDTIETDSGIFIDANDTGTNPLLLDGDGDNWDDGTEVVFGTDPTDPASSVDANSGKLLALDGARDDNFGISVALSSTGDTAIVGASWDDNGGDIYAGSASVLTRDSLGTWNLQQKLLAPDGGYTAAEFGHSVALSSTGDTAIVGAPRDYLDASIGLGAYAGSASVFTRDGAGTWSLQEKFLAPDGASADNFGISVALSSTGDTAVVGAWQDDTAGGDAAGSASVFTRDGAGTWTFQQQLLAPDGAAYDFFGTSVALSSTGGTAIVGAYSDDTAAGGADAGSASVFIRGGTGTWSFQEQLLAPGGGADEFGISVALSSTGDTAIVGAPFDDTAAGTDAGSASIFARDGGGSWNFQEQLLDPYGGLDDRFGFSVALSSTGDTAIVGAILADKIGGVPGGSSQGGSASVFTRDGAGTWIFQQQILAADRAGHDNFGISVALSSLGNTSIVGANNDDTAGGLNAGSAYVFDFLDTDDDGVPDISDSDDDGDGLLDTVETNTGIFVDATNTGTDPLIADTDGDGSDDGMEVDFGSDPLDEASFPPPVEVPALPAAGFALLAGAIGALGARRLAYRDRRRDT